MNRLIALSTGLLTVAAALFTFTASAEASYYYDESYYNKPIPCYQYDGAGHCVRSGNRYVSRTTRTNNAYSHNQNYYSTPYYNGSRYGNSNYNSSMYGNRSTYSTQYPYGWTNYGTMGTYRPVDNYYRSQQNNGCYWYYGSYRCDSR